MNKIFYYHKNRKVDVKIEPAATKYQIKLNDRELFILELAAEDKEESRRIVNNYLEKLEMH